MLWSLIKHMPYLAQRLWWWSIVIFHHYLRIGTHTTPHSLQRNTSDKYFLMTFCNWRLNKTNDRGYTSYWRCTADQWPASLQTGCWTGLQLSLRPRVNPSQWKKPLPAPMAQIYTLWQLFLYWVLQASHPQTPYPCELSSGLQGSSKQVPQVEDGAHQAALSNLKSASLSPWLMKHAGPQLSRAPLTCPAMPFCLFSRMVVRFPLGLHHSSLCLPEQTEPWRLGAQGVQSKPGRLAEGHQAQRWLSLQGWQALPWSAWGTSLCIRGKC